MKLFILISALLTVFLLPASAQKSKSYIVLDSVSGKVFYAKNTEVKRPVASLTKIATAKVVMDWTRLSKTPLTTAIVVPPSAATLTGANPLNLQPGDSLSIRDALYSALLGSDNVAAQTLANYVGFAILQKSAKQGEPLKAFVKEMNKLASSLQMNNTKFINPHGLDSAQEAGLSTATDIAKLSMASIQDEALSFIVKQKSRKITVTKQTGKTVSFTVKNTNALLGKQGVIGLKTGLTNRAGQCLATIASNKTIVTESADGKKMLRPRQLVIILLGSDSRFEHTSKLITIGWEAYEAWGKKGYSLAVDGSDTLRLPK